jgi:hypothetical protein
MSTGVKTVIAHKAAELAKTGATAQGTAQRVALEEWAAVKSVALGAWSAIMRIGQYAVEGAAAAFKAIAAIPIIGPALAPAAAAAAGLGDRAPSRAGSRRREGGYDIPSGVNPITQLHQNEMVLPAALADRVRNDGRRIRRRRPLPRHAMDGTRREEVLHGSTRTTSSPSGAERNFEGRDAELRLRRGLSVERRLPYPSGPEVERRILKSPRESSGRRKVTAQSVGGKEMRARYWSTPLYTWQLTYELLRRARQRAAGAAVADRLLQRAPGQVRFVPVLGSDATTTSRHGFGVGDGATKTAFQLQRTIAGPRSHAPVTVNPSFYPLSADAFEPAM